jgi:hypothetical protein
MNGGTNKGQAHGIKLSGLVSTLTSPPPSLSLLILTPFLGS